MCPTGRAEARAHACVPMPRVCLEQHLRRSRLRIHQCRSGHTGPSLIAGRNHARHDLPSGPRSTRPTLFQWRARRHGTSQRRVHNHLRHPLLVRIHSQWLRVCGKTTHKLNPTPSRMHKGHLLAHQWLDGARSTRYYSRVPSPRGVLSPRCVQLVFRRRYAACARHFRPLRPLRQTTWQL